MKTCNRLVRLLFAGIILSFPAACEKEKPVTFVLLSPAQVELVEGEETTITATVNPVDAEDRTLTWSLSSTETASIEQLSENTVKIKALKEGTAKVTAKSVNGKIGTTSLTVVKAPIPVTKITLDKADILLMVEDVYTLTASLSPENASNKNIVWKSDKPDVATVDSDGKVTAKDAGKAVITASSASQPIVTATCVVTVTDMSMVKVNGGVALEYKTGNLKTLLEGKTVKKLEWVIGKMNSTDAGYIHQNNTNLEYVDMRELRIIEGGDEYRVEAYNEWFKCSNDQFPPYIFYGAPKLKKVILPTSVDVIGYAAFQNATYLETVTTDGTVTFISDGAFGGCTRLSSINFFHSLDYIASGCFVETAFSGKLDLPNVRRFQFSSFKKCTKITEVSFGNKLEHPSGSAFVWCSALKKFSVDNSNPYFTAVDGMLVSRDGTTLYLYPYGKMGTTLEIPAGIKIINMSVFELCPATKVKLNEELEEIRSGAFMYTGFNNIELPASLKKLSRYVFAYNFQLTSVTMKGKTPPEIFDAEVSALSPFPFDDCSGLKTIYVPADAVNAYKTAPYWKEYKDFIKPAP